MSELAITPQGSSKAPSCVFDGSRSSSPHSTPNSSRSLSSVQYDSIYSCSSSFRQSSDGSGPAIRSKASARRQRLPYNRPQAPESLILEKRVVSLPEMRASFPVVNPTLEAKTATIRVVSLAERPKPMLENSPSPIQFRPSVFKHGSFLFDHEEQPLSHGRTSNSHLLRTPSPPSSPESSILIIENDPQLPKTFLRNKPSLKSHLEYPDDEGWITWASSPPRPIPALHGPLSLPYARCPSGAEGTIIGSPATVSGMIWGLGTEDPPQCHFRVNPQNAHSNTRNSTPTQPKQNAPAIRSQTTQNLTSSALSSQSERQNTPLARPTIQPLTENDRQTQTALHHRALETLGYRHNTGNGAIELDDMLQTGGTAITGTWGPLYGAGEAKAPEASGVGLLRCIKTKGLGFDWQSALTYDEDSAGFGQGLEQSDYIKPSAQIFAPSSEDVHIQPPRVSAEPQTLQLPQNALPRRLSAIEIAKQYRQKQQIESGLPTPPSSSTQWSPFLSSYCEPYLSPEVSVSRPSRPLSAHYQTHKLPLSDPSQDRRRFFYDRISPVIANSSTDLPQSPTSPAQVFQTPSAIRQQSQRLNPPLSKYANHCSAVSSQAFGPSPLYPQSPTSTILPLPSLDASYGLVSPAARPPEIRIRSLSQQLPRSVPLARLIRRRLSSVPEEDSMSFMDRNRSASPPSLPPRSTSLRSTPVQVVSKHLPLLSSRRRQQSSSSVNVHKKARTPSPVPETLMPRSKFDAGILQPESSTVKVKLPSKFVKTARYVDRDRVKLWKNVDTRSHIEDTKSITPGKGLSQRKKGRNRKT